MSHFLYSTKQAKKSYHPIPSTLGPDDVLKVLHNHSTLASIFWPLPHTAKDQGNAISEAKQMTPNTTEFRIGSASGSGPGPSAARCKASITSHTEAREVVVEEDMPLGLEMALVYRVTTSSDLSPDSDTSKGDNLLSVSSPGLYLEVERSVLAPRLLSFLVKAREGPILKTRNLLWVLEEMGRNGKDLGAALDQLRVHDGDCDAAESRLEKDKAD